MRMGGSEVGAKDRTGLKPGRILLNFCFVVELQACLRSLRRAAG